MAHIKLGGLDWAFTILVLHVFRRGSIWKILLFIWLDPSLFLPISHCLIFPANSPLSYFYRQLIDSAHLFPRIRFYPI
jgi:hypothetical protein